MNERFSITYKNLLISGAALFIFATFFWAWHQMNRERIPECKRVHTYINPELDCINIDAAYSKIRTSEEGARKYISQYTKDTHAVRISVYYRDIETKRWYGVNENDYFTPSSLLKLPLAITYFKLAEIDPNILSLEFDYKTGDSLNVYAHFKSAPPLVAGTPYRIDSMIERMLVHSDNDVVPTLVQYVDKGFYNKVLVDLGVNVPPAAYGGIHSDFLSVKVYAAILRTLYNASYLNPDQSEKILALLTQSTFTEGLVAGVPRGTVVAHKFGEGVEMDPATMKVTTRELHDCGIIYHPKNPYILCIMTEGQNFDELKDIIADISRIVWENSNLE